MGRTGQTRAGVRTVVASEAGTASVLLLVATTGEVVINTVMASATTGNAGVVLTLLAVHGLGAATLESVCGSVV